MHAGNVGGIREKRASKMEILTNIQFYCKDQLCYRGHPKASHFPKWAVLVGKCIVLKPKMGSSKTWASQKYQYLFYLLSIKQTKKNLKKPLCLNIIWKFHKMLSQNA